MASAAPVCSHPSVTVVGRHTVQALGGEPTFSAGGSPLLRLGPLDGLVLPFIPVAVVYAFHQPQEDSTELVSLSRLRRALSCLLREYPQLTGRLLLSNQSRAIHQLGSGMEVVEAVCSDRLDAFSSSSDGGAAMKAPLRIVDLPDGGNALLAAFDPSLEAVCRAPLFTVQHTRFACGSVTLGVRVLHTVCDADGFFQLMQDLFELYRSIRPSESPEKGPPQARLSQSPHIQSFLADLSSMSEEERGAALQFKPSLFQLAPAPAEATTAAVEAFPVAGSPEMSLPPPSVVGRILRFSARELNALKSHASDPSGDGWVSTFDALAAHLYQRIYVARVQHLQESGAAAPSALSTDFLTPINCRGAHRLNLPSRYFPNALMCTYFTLPPETLAGAPLSVIARAVHDSVRLLSQQEAIDTVRWIAAQPDKSRITQGFHYENGGFMISQWSRFALYTNAALDVDERNRAIPPILVSTPFTPISLLDGLAYILPTEDQVKGDEVTASAVKDFPSSPTAPPLVNSASFGCSLDVNLALSEPLWAILNNDPLFRPFRNAAE